jgi:hypothetical protein
MPAWRRKDLAAEGYVSREETPSQETAIRVIRFSILAVVVAAQLVLVVVAATVGDARDIRVVLAATTILMLVPSVSLFLALAPDQRWRELGIRAFLPRLRIRSLMLLVILAALMAGAMVLQQRLAERAQYCRDQAKLHADRANVQILRANLATTRAALLHEQLASYPKDEAFARGEKQSIDESRRCVEDAQAEFDVKERFERAARYPWLPLPAATAGTGVP